MQGWLKGRREKLVVSISCHMNFESDDEWLHVLVFTVSYRFSVCMLGGLNIQFLVEVCVCVGMHPGVLTV